MLVQFEFYQNVMSCLMRLQKKLFADAVDSLRLTVDRKIKELEKYVQRPKSTFRPFAVRL